ncbi:YggT family protein [Candidatus Woesebacteria bacterium]|nr:YggT family protein [Candidatus Woesebacteria bacterium]MCD8506958.1 YggT family protein [Candidatus Woesebacteria bacterium]MCD8527248.1 YggT family protein [Candidatus Woesebacteria bacterium]MCD8546616.1 YggT family protein [Candidatus Woesebacteria bacterium]
MATRTTDCPNQPVDNQDKPYLVMHQFLDFGLFLIEGFLLLSFLLKMAGANRATGFVQFVLGISDVLMAPFQFIFPVAQTGQYVFDWSILVAMLVYALIVIALRQAIAMVYTADRA